MLTSSSTARNIPRTKRAFDITVAVLSAPLWIPVCAIAGLALGLNAGWPVLYRSQRRVHGRTQRTVMKFRTMVRDADKLLNRETVPVTDTCFLNIPPEHPVYTPVGRVIERYALTELPQLLHVLVGTMSLIGNRPLPVNVVSALLVKHPYAEDRFLSPGGLTGPIQLIGRDNVSDADRLALEIDYCLLTTLRYSYRIDLSILLSTVWVALHLRAPFKISEVRAMMMKAAAPQAIANDGSERRVSGLRFSLREGHALSRGVGRVELRELSYRGLGVVIEREVPIGTDLAVPTSAGGELRARLCWLRPRPDGRFDAGLSLPSAGNAAGLLSLLDGRATTGSATAVQPLQPAEAEDAPNGDAPTGSAHAGLPTSG